MYNRKDHYYRKAKKEGKASRAAYKILEIQQKYKIWKKGDTILDLGCAPGGWLQVLSKEVGPKGRIIGVDRLPLKIRIPENVTFHQTEIEKLDIDVRPNVILSDMAPNLTGIPFKDTTESHALCYKVWEIAGKQLQAGGNLVLKIFPSEEAQTLRKELKSRFQKVDAFVPKAVRKGSSEVYFVALRFQPSD